MFGEVNEPWFLMFVSIVYFCNILLKVKTNNGNYFSIDITILSQIKSTKLYKRVV